MLLIPAIDIKDGQCVRLYQGDYKKVTVFSQEPIEVARHWEALGARLLHVVDLDGALTGIGKNVDLIGKIAAAVNIPVEVGGGIRKLNAIEVLLDLKWHRA